ncbi:MAG: hypothetical protein JJU18_06895 [Oceanicaulis sp.]|nr:hypothetical protein [Oceanicaulis sp.]
MRLRFSALAALATLAVCAAGPVHAAQPGLQSQGDLAGDPRLGEQVDRICTGRQLRAFSDATEHHIVVRAGRDRHYLLETVGSCVGLERAHQVAFHQFSLCLAPGDRLLGSEATPTRLGASAPQRGASRTAPRNVGFGCQISAIHEWNPDARATDTRPVSGSAAQR